MVAVDNCRCSVTCGELLEEAVDRKLGAGVVDGVVGDVWDDHRRRTCKKKTGNRSMRERTKFKLVCQSV